MNQFLCKLQKNGIILYQIRSKKQKKKLEPYFNITTKTEYRKQCDTIKKWLEKWLVNGVVDSQQENRNTQENVVQQRSNLLLNAVLSRRLDLQKTTGNQEWLKTFINPSTSINTGKHTLTALSNYQDFTKKNGYTVDQCIINYLSDSRNCSTYSNPSHVIELFAQQIIMFYKKNEDAINKSLENNKSITVTPTENPNIFIYKVLSQTFSVDVSQKKIDGLGITFNSLEEIAWTTQNIATLIKKFWWRAKQFVVDDWHTAWRYYWITMEDIDEWETRKEELEIDVEDQWWKRSDALDDDAIARYMTFFQNDKTKLQTLVNYLNKKINPIP